MRHTTLFISALLASGTSAQDYLANEPVWAVHSVCGVPAPCIANDTYNYFTVGDSVINNVTWTKVQRAGTVTFNWQSAPPMPPDCQGTEVYGVGLHGTWLIRQEARQLRIWINDVDQLLHEFDLVAGQTLPMSYANWNEDITVLAVDSVLIGTEMRARYELANSWATYLVEGVGSSHGLFEPISNFFDCGYGLDCFGLGAESYYPAAGGSCWLPMGIGLAPADEVTVVAPNPASDLVVLSGVRSNEDVIVYDPFGRVVLRQRGSIPSVSLDVSMLPEGCYTLMLGQGMHRLVVARKR